MLHNVCIIRFAASTVRDLSRCVAPLKHANFAVCYPGSAQSVTVAYGMQESFPILHPSAHVKHL